jgi:glycosyltransferase involved in cell wall biosynthesis
MNILNAYPYPDVKAGTERSMHVGAWATQEAGHRIYLLHQQTDVPHTAEKYDAQLGVPAIFNRASKAPPAGLADAEAQVDAFIREHQIDVISVHGYPRTSVLAHWAQKYPTVVTVHVPLCPNGARYLWKDRRPCDRSIGLGCLTTGFLHKGCGHLGNQEPNSLPGFVRGMAEDHLLRRAIGQCSRIVAPSRWMMSRLSQDGIPAKNIRLVNAAIADGINTDKLPLQIHPPVVAFVGRLVDFKGPDQLLKASALIRSEHRIWFIGEGPMKAQLEDLTKQMHLNDRVSFLGAMPPESIAQFRAESSIVVVPSLWQDNFPMVGPEAMLMRRPVVAYRVGGIPEWLKDGVTGRLVEPGDVQGLAHAIEGLLNDPDGARAMGEAGRELALQWTAQEHARRLLDVYQEAVAAAV